MTCDGDGKKKGVWLISYLGAHWEIIWGFYKLGLLNNIEIFIFQIFFKILII